MCIAVPAKIIEVNDNEAIVNNNGVKIKTNIMLISDPKPGEYVLIHAGCAIEKIDEAYAIETLDLFKELSNAIKECENSASSKKY